MLYQQWRIERCTCFNRKEKTLEVYQQQVTCMMRMKQEVLQLKYTVSIILSTHSTSEFIA